MNNQKYWTRMYLRERRGWSKKMIEDLLEGVPYKEWGNYYRWRYDKII